MSNYINESFGRSWKTKDTELFLYTQGQQWELFEMLEKEKIRPLGAISDFVTWPMKQTSLDQNFNFDELHDILQLIRKESDKFAQSRWTYLHNLKEPEIALIDLLYLKTFLKKKHNKVDSSLEYLIDNIAQYNGRIPQLTYEDLIITNPIDNDPRTFFTGKLWYSELEFYKGHNIIEQHFDVAINHLWDLMEMLDNSDDMNNEMQEKANAFMAAWRTCMQYLGKFHSLSKEDFTLFRGYFIGDEERKFRWPSGAFSPGIPIIDITIWLNSLDTANPGYLDENIIFYPKLSQIHIRNARDRLTNQKSLLHYAIKHNNDQLKQIYMEIGTAVMRFRQSHLSIIQSKAPDIANGSMPGSGNFTVDAFLLANIKANEENMKK